MQTGVIVQHSRTDIRLTGAQQGAANVLFIYTGEADVSFAGADHTYRDQFSIELPDADIAPAGNKPVPIIFPTGWNASGVSLGIVSVENPTLGLKAGSLTGLILTADVAVQNAMLLRVQYQVSVLAFV